MPTPEELYRLNFPDQTLGQSFQKASDATTDLDTRLGSIQDQIDAEIRMLALRGRDPFRAEAVPGVMGQPRPTETTPEQLRLLMGGRDPFQRYADTYNPLQLHSSQLPRELTAEEMKGPPLSLIQQHLQQGGFDPNTDLTYAQKVGLSRGAVDSVGEMAKQRQMSAYQAAQLEMEKQKLQWSQPLEIIGNPNLSPDQAMQALREQGKTNPIAGMLGQGLSGKIISDFRRNAGKMRLSPDEYIKGMQDGTITLNDIVHDSNIVDLREKAIREARKDVDLMESLQQEVDRTGNPFAAQALATMKAKQQEQQAVSTTKQEEANIARPKAQADLRKAQRDAGAAGYEIRTVPIDNQGTMGTMLFDKTTGTGRLLQQGTPIQKQQLMPSAMLKERSETLAAISQLRQVASQFHPDFVGTFDAAKNSIARMFGSPTVRERIDKGGKAYQVNETDFRVAYDMLQKLLRREAMGTAQSVHELSTNPLAFPSADDRDADVTIPAFLRSQFQSLTYKLEAQDSVMDQNRRANPVPVAERYRQLSELSRAQTPDGTNALGFSSEKEREEAIAQRLAEEIQRGWVIQ